MFLQEYWAKITKTRCVFGLLLMGNSVLAYKNQNENICQTRWLLLAMIIGAVLFEATLACGGRSTYRDDSGTNGGDDGANDVADDGADDGRTNGEDKGSICRLTGVLWWCPVSAQVIFTCAEMGFLDDIFSTCKNDLC